MLQFQIKINSNGQATAFINTDHDAAESNSTYSELKNAVTDLGGTLTELINYEIEDQFQLAKALISSSGYVYVPSTQSANSVEITQAGTSANSLPTISQITNKIVTYIASDSNTSTTVNVKWGGGANINILNIDGSLLRIGQIKENSKVSILYNGSKWVLVDNDKNFIINDVGNISHNGATIPESPDPELNSIFWPNSYSECRFDGSLYQCTGCYLTTGGVNYRATATGKITVTVVDKNGVNKNYNIEAVSGNDYQLASMNDSPLILDDFAVKMKQGLQVNIATFGDSTVDGDGTTSFTPNPTSGGDAIGTTDHNLTAPNAWSVKLRDILRDMFDNSNIQVSNCGYGGKRLDDGWALSNYDAATTYPRDTYGAVDVVFIGFGINDSQDSGSQVDAHIEQLRLLCDKVILGGAIPVILSTDPISQKPPRSSRDNMELVLEINLARKSFAKKRGYDFVDFNGLIKDWFSYNADGYRWGVEQTDTLHLKDNGHKMKASICAKALYNNLVIVGRNDGSSNYINAFDSRIGGNFSGLQNYYNINNSRGSNNYSFTSPNAPVNENIFTMWVWNESTDARLDYMGMDNEDVVYPATRPSIGIEGMISDTNVSKEIISSQFDRSFYNQYNRSDETFIHGFLPWGLSKVTYYTGDSDSAYFGSFRIVPNADRYYRVDAIKQTQHRTYLTGQPSNYFELFNELDLSGKSELGGFVGDEIDIYYKGDFPQKTGIFLTHQKGFNFSQSAVDDNIREGTLLFRESNDNIYIYNVAVNDAGASQLQQVKAGGLVSWPIGGGVNSDEIRIKIQRDMSVPTDVKQIISVYSGHEENSGTVVNFVMDGKIESSARWGGLIGGLWYSNSIASLTNIKVEEFYAILIQG